MYLLLSQCQSIPNSLYRSEFIKFYPIFTGIISTISLYVSFKFTRGNFRNNITLTTICFTLLLFPYGANEYKCIYLIIPFLLGINSLSKLKDSNYKSNILENDNINNPVTSADLKVNEIIIQRINEKYKKVNWDILSEESVKVATESFNINSDWIIPPEDALRYDNYGLYDCFVLKNCEEMYEKTME